MAERRPLPAAGILLFRSGRSNSARHLEIRMRSLLKITNPFSFAVDISEWEITGGIEHTFAPGTVIASGGSLYVSPDVNTFRARSVSPTGGEGPVYPGEIQRTFIELS
jgi:hypothetical protein